MTRRRSLRLLFRRRNGVLLFAILAIAAGLWGGGFLFFLSAIPRAAATNVTTDAVIVLTGGSLRLEAGLAVLADGGARKLFVSGVHRDVGVKELLRNTRRAPQSLDCCIALGYTADNTRGNARETAAWMARERFRSLRLVTANYHMPRSLREFRAAMPQITIVPHPVFPAHVRLGDWWRWPGTAMLLAGEYNKLLLARARLLVQPAIDLLYPPARQT